MKRFLNAVSCVLFAAVFILNISSAPVSADDAYGNAAISAYGDFCVFSADYEQELGAIETVGGMLSGVRLVPAEGYYVSRITVSAEREEGGAEADITRFFSVDCTEGAGTAVYFCPELIEAYMDSKTAHGTDNASAAELFAEYVYLETGADITESGAVLTMSVETAAVDTAANAGIECFTTVPEEYEYEPEDTGIVEDHGVYDEISGQDEGTEAAEAAELEETQAVQLNSAKAPVPDTVIETEGLPYKASLPQFGTESLDAAALGYGKRFEGWRIEYPNGMQTRVSASDAQEITVFGDVRAYSFWTDCDVCVISVNDINKVYDGSTAAPEDAGSFSMEINGQPSECTLSSYTLTCSTADVTDSGETGIVPAADAAVIYPDGNPVFGEDEKPYMIIVPGRLTVSRRDLTISTGSASKDYDGTALSSSEYACQGLAQGDELTAVRLSGSVTGAGRTENTVEGFSLVNGSGHDVSGNYNISYSLGTLEVKPVTASIKAVESTAEYDGKPHTAAEYTVTGFASGDTPAVTFTGSATYVSDEGLCTPACSGVTDGSGHDVSGNYSDISCTAAKLTILPRRITISTGSASKSFDGEALECREFTISSGSLAEGDRISLLPITGRQIYVGSGKNTVDLNSVSIVNSNGKDVTSSYSITVKEGTLTVKEDISKLSLTIKLKSGVIVSKVYDAKPLTISADDFECTGLPAGYRCSLSLNLSTASVVDCGKTKVEISSYVIYDSNGKIVGNSSDHSFNISFSDVYLEILPRDLTITAASASKVYDGKTLTCHNVASATGTLALDTHTLNTKDIVYQGSQTEVGSSANKIVSVVIRDSTGKDVTANYNIKFVDGTLQVTAAPGQNGNSGSTSGSNSVTTGDTANVPLWGCVMLGSLAGILFWTIRRRKKH